MIRAGYLRDKVTLLAPEKVDDPAWGPTSQWVPAGTIWCCVTPVSATERAANAGVQSAISYRISMRWRPDVTSQHRVVYRGRILELVGVFDVDGRRQELVADAREYPQEGGANVA